MIPNLWLFTDLYQSYQTSLRFLKNFFMLDLINISQIKRIFHDNQFGFHPKLSTCLTLLQLIDELTRSVNEGNVMVGVFTDLAEAFDTVDHGILLKKLHFYGIRGVPHQWFSNYLENRKQFITINTNSSFSNITCGVP